MSVKHDAAVSLWAERHFSGAELSDVRRVNRAVFVAEAFACAPGGTIPQLFHHPYDVKAAYSFFRHEEATPDNLQSGHRQLVMDELFSPGVYLLIEDTSEQSFSGRNSIKGLGPIGEGQSGVQGFLLHSVLAVRFHEPGVEGLFQSKRPELDVLGLCDQQFHVRQRRPETERLYKDAYVRKKRARESQLWEQASRRVGRAPESEQIQWVKVADRGSDIYEHMIECQQMGQGFVIRATQDRALTEKSAQVQGESPNRLFKYARSLEEKGEFSLKLRARTTGPGKSRRKKRTVRLKVSTGEVSLRSPQRPKSAVGKAAPVECSVVRVWEENAPEAEKPLEWILLTSQKVESLEEAVRVARQYSCRWVIEEFHKALKSGLGAERLQLESAEGLFAAIAIMSVVAVRLIELKERVRVNAQAKAEESGLSRIELEVLRRRSRKEIESVADVALAVGRLGGHMNRKADGMPGWQTLWRGMNRLNALVDGYLLARNLDTFG